LSASGDVHTQLEIFSMGVGIPQCLYFFFVLVLYRCESAYLKDTDAYHYS